MGGNIHGINGKTRDDFRARVDTVFTAATELGRKTIGIGDGGNEVGFGRIREALLAASPGHNEAEITPCGGGLLSATATDVRVAGTTLITAAYDVVATLAMRRDKLDFCHTAEL